MFPRKYKKTEKLQTINNYESKHRRNEECVAVKKERKKE